jgi:hypothetical protein
MTIRKLLHSAVLLAALLIPQSATAAVPKGVELPDLDDDVEVTEGVVTALSCALETQRTGDLAKLNACPMKEIASGLVVYSVVDRLIFKVSSKAVYRYELEGAFGGGSIDLEGTAAAIDAKSGVVTVDVDDYTVTPKPKAGSFKGCL